MKRFFTLILAILAVMACTPNLEPEGQDPQEPAELAVESEVLSTNTLSLQPGEKANLTGRVYPDNCKVHSVTWTSSNEGVATVENGLVTALAAGEAIITAKVEDFSVTCTVTVTVPFSYGGMCMEAINSASLSIYNPNGLAIEYKVENNDWTSSNGTSINIRANTGERVWFRGRNESYSGVIFRNTSGSFYLYGNLMSLIYGDDFEDKKELTAKETFYELFIQNSGIYNHPAKDIELPATTLTTSCYRNMFYKCPNLKKAMSVLPATELAPNCYTGMFQRADKLENAPKLPATELTYSCYSHMFNGCKALKNAPKLPATKLAEACYQRMFCNTLLTEAPELPATDMEVGCYQYMFQNCTELEKAPVLPATRLSFWCNGDMFKGCSKLNYIKALFLNKPSDYYTPGWVAGVAENGTLVKNPNATWDVRGINGIPEGWTVEY